MDIWMFGSRRHEDDEGTKNAKTLAAPPTFVLFVLRVLSVPSRLRDPNTLVIHTLRATIDATRNRSGFQLRGCAPGALA
jgi:hypothetical protein